MACLSYHVKRDNLVCCKLHAESTFRNIEKGYCKFLLGCKISSMSALKRRQEAKRELSSTEIMFYHMDLGRYSLATYLTLCIINHSCLFMQKANIIISTLADWIQDNKCYNCNYFCSIKCRNRRQKHIEM